MNEISSETVYSLWKAEYGSNEAIVVISYYLCVCFTVPMPVIFSEVEESTQHCWCHCMYPAVSRDGDRIQKYDAINFLKWWSRHHFWGKWLPHLLRAGPLFWPTELLQSWRMQSDSWMSLLNVLLVKCFHIPLLSKTSMKSVRSVLGSKPLHKKNKIFRFWGARDVDIKYGKNLRNSRPLCFILCASEKSKVDLRVEAADYAVISTTYMRCATVWLLTLHWRYFN